MIDTDAGLLALTITVAVPDKSPVLAEQLASVKELIVYEVVDEGATVKI